MSTFSRGQPPVNGQPHRSVRFIDAGWPDLAHVVITVGRQSTDYTLERFDVPPEQQGEGFRFIKCCPVPDGHEPHFHVLLSHLGHDCDCPGFAAHGLCEHVDSLLDLKRDGSI